MTAWAWADRDRPLLRDVADRRAIPPPSIDENHVRRWTYYDMGIGSRRRPFWKSTAALTPAQPSYWFMMQIGMSLGFLTAYPMNWWLLKSGIKEKM
jgi:hypothetical protein